LALPHRKDPPAARRAGLGGPRGAGRTLSRPQQREGHPPHPWLCWGEPRRAPGRFSDVCFFSSFLPLRSPVLSPPLPSSPPSLPVRDTAPLQRHTSRGQTQQLPTVRFRGGEAAFWGERCSPRLCLHPARTTPARTHTRARWARLSGPRGAGSTPRARAAVGGVPSLCRHLFLRASESSRARLGCLPFPLISHLCPFSLPLLQPDPRPQARSNPTRSTSAWRRTH
jgi:hypothetical protein